MKIVKPRIWDTEKQCYVSEELEREILFPLEEGGIYGMERQHISEDPEDLTKNPWIDTCDIVELRDWPIKNIVSEPEDLS